MFISFLLVTLALTSITTYFAIARCCRHDCEIKTQRRIDRLSKKLKEREASMKSFEMILEK